MNQSKQVKSNGVKATEFKVTPSQKVKVRTAKVMRPELESAAKSVFIPEEGRGGAVVFIQDAKGITLHLLEHASKVTKEEMDAIYEKAFDDDGSVSYTEAEGMNQELYEDIQPLLPTGQTAEGFICTFDNCRRTSIVFTARLTDSNGLEYEARVVYQDNAWNAIFGA